MQECPIMLLYLLHVLLKPDLTPMYPLLFLFEQSVVDMLILWHLTLGLFPFQIPLFISNDWGGKIPPFSIDYRTAQRFGPISISVCSSAFGVIFPIFTWRISWYAFGCGGKFSVTVLRNSSSLSMFKPWFSANRSP